LSLGKDVFHRGKRSRLREKTAKGSQSRLTRVGCGYEPAWVAWTGQEICTGGNYREKGKGKKENSGMSKIGKETRTKQERIRIKQSDGPMEPSTVKKGRIKEGESQKSCSPVPIQYERHKKEGKKPRRSSSPRWIHRKEPQEGGTEQSSEGGRNKGRPISMGGISNRKGCH